MVQNKVLSLLGLCAKAGKITSGEFSVEKSVKKGRACLVIVAQDASDNTKKLFTNMCTHYGVPIYMVSTKEELGRSIGKEKRASVAILDEGLSRAMEKQIKNQEN